MNHWFGKNMLCIFLSIFSLGNLKRAWKKNTLGTGSNRHSMIYSSIHCHYLTQPAERFSTPLRPNCVVEGVSPSEATRGSWDSMNNVVRLRLRFYPTFAPLCEMHMKRIKGNLCFLLLAQFIVDTKVPIWVALAM